MSKQRVTTSFICLVLAVFVAGTVVAQEEPPPAPVHVAYALEQEMAPNLWVPGTVASRNQASIAAEVSGQLTWVAEVGDLILQGQPVARIDDQALQLRLKNDDATIKRLEAQLDYLDQQVKRLQRLTEQQVAPANDLEEAESQREAVNQQLVQAKVAKEQTRYELDRSQVKAPFTGEIVARIQQPGSYSSVGEEIVHLVDTVTVEVRTQAPLSVAPFLREGMKVQVSDRNVESEARIRRIIQVGDQRSRMFEIRLDLGEGSWIVGSPVRVALPNGASRNVIAVPRDALILRTEGTYIFKVSEEGTAEKVVVETGMGESSLIEIRGEVDSGDKVVVRGGERLRPGQAVSISTGNGTPAS